MTLQFRCPHCGKDVFLIVKKDPANDPRGLISQIVKLRQQKRAIKKKPENISR